MTTIYQHFVSLEYLIYFNIGTIPRDIINLPLIRIFSVYSNLLTGRLVDDGFSPEISTLTIVDG
jgi:hypothetical protein